MKGTTSIYFYETGLCFFSYSVYYNEYNIEDEEIGNSSVGRRNRKTSAA